MTYNVFSGTSNPTQSQSPARLNAGFTFTPDRRRCCYSVTLHRLRSASNDQRGRRKPRLNPTTYTVGIKGILQLDT